MSLTAYHAKLFAHELTKRSSSDNVDKLASALSDGQVDLNPHQIEAARFAFRSTLSKGAILAGRVGLGKTIEAGILVAQHWAELRRTLLLLCPPKPWRYVLIPHDSMTHSTRFDALLRLYTYKHSDDPLGVTRVS
jgi:SNF2 family DNA or RNA helicase